MQSIMSRRRFMAGCAVIGAALLNENSFAVSGVEVPAPGFAQLWQSLDAQCRLHGSPLSPENSYNLSYACKTIAPKSHTEAALVVWAGSQSGSVALLIDEYCRRRSGQSSKLFDHPALAIKAWCRPETRRILVFREQLKALSRELTGRNLAFRVFKGNGESGCSLEMFNESLQPHYKETLPTWEVEELYLYIREMYAVSREYSWCATIVERAVQAA